MCLYPSLMINKKYIATKKNRGKIPKLNDERLRYVAVGCQVCEECRRKRKNEWQIRLHEESRHSRQAVFVTLTFSEESINDLEKYYIEKHEGEIPDANQTAKTGIRLFLERWRKKYGTSIKHWLITELGHKGTERIHLHGILFQKIDKKELDKIWKYGHTWVGYCNAKTINYVVKYCMKVDEKHKNFIGRIFTSKGIGQGYTKTWDFEQNRYQGPNTNEHYRLPSGHKKQLPIYYRNKVYNERQREHLWRIKLDKEERFIQGIRIPFKTDEDKERYFKTLEYYQMENRRKGYSCPELWEHKKYENRVNKINKYFKKKQHEQATSIYMDE